MQTSRPSRRCSRAIVHEQRAVYDSVHSDRIIRRERWQLHVNEAARDRLIEEIVAETVAGGNVVNVGSSTSFAPGRNEYEAGPHPYAVEE